MYKFSVAIFKRLWTTKSRKRGYDDSQQVQPATSVEANESLTSTDLTTRYSQSSKDCASWSDSSSTRKRLFQEFNATNSIESLQSRTNWNASWEDQACNSKHLLIDPDIVENRQK